MTDAPASAGVTGPLSFKRLELSRRAGIDVGRFYAATIRTIAEAGNASNIPLYERQVRG